jgi:hypothetical protein
MISAQMVCLNLRNVIEGRQLGKGIFVGNCQHLFRRPMILHGEHTYRVRVPESLL